VLFFFVCEKLLLVHPAFVFLYFVSWCVFRGYGLLYYFDLVPFSLLFVGFRCVLFFCCLFGLFFGTLVFLWCGGFFSWFLFFFCFFFVFFFFLFFFFCCCGRFYDLSNVEFSFFLSSFRRGVFFCFCFFFWVVILPPIPMLHFVFHRGTLYFFFFFVLVFLFPFFTFFG